MFSARIGVGTLRFYAGWRRYSGIIRSLSVGFQRCPRLRSAHQLWNLTADRARLQSLRPRPRHARIARRLRPPLPRRRSPHVAAFVAFERRCCPFFRFALVLDPDDGPLTMTITGPQCHGHPHHRDRHPLTTPRPPRQQPAQVALAICSRAATRRRPQRHTGTLHLPRPRHPPPATSAPHTPPQPPRAMVGRYHARAHEGLCKASRSLRRWRHVRCAILHPPLFATTLGLM